MMRIQTIMSHIIASALCMVTISCYASSCDSNHSHCANSGKSFLWVQPQFQSASPELISTFPHHNQHDRASHHGGVFQAVLFGGQSTHNNNLTRHFTPFCKTSLNVRNGIGQDLATDLLAQHFNIFTADTFESTIAFEVEQSTIALGLQYRQDFTYANDHNRHCFFSISSPLTHIKNNFSISEKIIHNGGPIDKAANPHAVSSMTEAFKQPEWHYGRIESTQAPCSSCPQTKTHLADIEVKLGIEWFNEKLAHVESYIGALIPTGNKATSVRIFETIVGNGGHPGIMFGGAGHNVLWHDEQCHNTIKVECAMHSLYLFRSRQMRSLDLKNKPFSRYMELYKNKKQAQEAATLMTQADALPADSPEAKALYARATSLATPGINLFTLPTYITPGFQYNVTTALTFSNVRGYHLEAGYNFFTRQADHASLACPWQSGPALKSINGGGKTNPARDITGNIFLNSIDGTKNSFENYDQNMITQNDLDLNSTTQPAGIAHTFYGSMGYECNKHAYPLIAHLGTSYEFANASSALINRWTLWAKMGVSF